MLSWSEIYGVGEGEAYLASRCTMALVRNDWKPTEECVMVTFIGAVLGGLRLACKPTCKGSEKSGPFGFSELDTNVRVSRWW